MRLTIQASAIASYMGVGFRSPEEQLQIDLGNTKPIFTQDQRHRMRAGTVLEDAILDYFEHDDWLGEPIFDRNTERREGYDNKISYMIDGRTTDAIVDAKFSSSQESFVFNMTYIVQMQAYMLCEDMNKAILLGIDKSTPVWRIIDRDEEMIEDIKAVVDNVHAILLGMLEPSDLRLDIAEKYSSEIIEEDDTFDVESDKELLEELVSLKEDIKEKSDRQKEIENYLKDKYNRVEYEDDTVKIKLAHYTRKGAIDNARLINDYPTLNMDDYRKEPTKMTRLTTGRVENKEK